jgi:hypothetical protein
MSDHRIFADLGEERKIKGKKTRKPTSELTRIILAAGIIALLAWNIFFVDWKQPGVDRTETEVPVEDVENSDKPVPLSGLISGGTQDSDADVEAYTGEGGEARTLIAEARESNSPPSNSDLYDKAMTYAQEGSLADAYLLHFYLVKQGYGPSAMVLAEMADPNHRNPKTSFYDAPDFTQAHKWYVQALMLGENQAEQRLAELKLRVKAAAAGGDEKARRLLVGW